MDLQDNESTREFTSVKALREAEEAERIEENGSEPEHEEQPEEKEPEQTNLLADVMDILESIIISVFLVLTAYTYLFCVASVEGTSMVPTLQDKDRLFVTRICNTYETGDILIIQSDHAYVFDEDGKIKENPGLDKRIVKRLIAVGGQEVNIDFDAGEVYVDGKKLDEPYINAPTKRNEGAFRYPITVPDGYVFVLGDNRGISRDSRDPNVALIPMSDVVGEVRFRIAPLSGFGAVE